MLRNVEIVHAGDAPERRGPRLHRHAWSELIWVRRGRYEVEVQGRLHRCGPNTALLYAAGVEHRPAFLPDARGIGEVVVAQFDARPGTGLPAPVPMIDRSGRIRAAIDWLVDLRVGGPGDAAAAEHVLAAVIHELGRRSPREPYLVASVRTWLNAHPGVWPRANALAAALGLSRSRLLHIFPALAGAPLMRFVRQCRLAEAEALIASGVSAAEAATRCGFAHASHLARWRRRRS